MNASRTDQASPVEVPPAFLACMNPEDRARYSPMTLATSSVIFTPAVTMERATKADARAEKGLQNEFEQWLLLHGYMYYRVPMHKRSMLPAGYPDFTIWLDVAKILWIEYKTEVGQLSPDQTEYHRQLQERGHAVFLSRSLRYSIDCLRGVERATTKEGTPR